MSSSDCHVRHECFCPAPSLAPFAPGIRTPRARGIDLDRPVCRVWANSHARSSSRVPRGRDRAAFARRRASRDRASGRRDRARDAERVRAGARAFARGRRASLAALTRRDRERAGFGMRE